jgi:hypothetical protein
VRGLDAAPGTVVVVRFGSTDGWVVAGSDDDRAMPTTMTGWDRGAVPTSRNNVAKPMATTLTSCFISGALILIIGEKVPPRPSVTQLSFRP